MEDWQMTENRKLNADAIYAGMAWVRNASKDDRDSAWGRPSDELYDRIFPGERRSVACGISLAFDIMGESPALMAIVAEGDIYDDAKMVGPVLGVPEIVMAIRQFLCGVPRPARQRLSRHLYVVSDH
jgi:hypothetical protein